MVQTELRRLYAEEMLDAMFNLGMYAFRATPPFPDREEWLKFARMRKGITYLAMCEDQKAVAGAGSTPMKENIRGHIYASAAIWGVAAHPAARRKGYIRQIMTAMMAADRENGHAFSTLYPFRESFYERMGYTTFPLPLETCFSAAPLRGLLDKDLGGEVVLKAYADVYDLYREYLYQIQPSIHGMAVFDFANPGSVQRFPLWAALAYVDGQLDGVMLYQNKGEEITRFTMNAPRFHYRSSRGRSLLLAWIARHIDQVEQVTIHLPPFERPETWWPDLKVKTTSLTPGPMGRVLDISRIQGMQTGPGSFTAAILDPMCPWNEGNWQFETISGCLSVSPVKHAQLTLSIQAMAALIYGSIDPQDFWLRGWGNPDPDLQQVMRTMFPPITAHLHEDF